MARMRARREKNGKITPPGTQILGYVLARLGKNMSRIGGLSYARSILVFRVNRGVMEPARARLPRRMNIINGCPQSRPLTVSVFLTRVTHPVILTEVGAYATKEVFLIRMNYRQPVGSASLRATLKQILAVAEDGVHSTRPVKSAALTVDTRITNRRTDFVIISLNTEMSSVNIVTSARLGPATKRWRRR